MYLGIDIGSVAVKVVVISFVGDKIQVLETHYVRSHGQPFETTRDILKDVFSRFACPVPTKNPAPMSIGGASSFGIGASDERDGIEFIATTGTGGKKLAEIIRDGIVFVNEITAQVEGTSRFYPSVRTIIEIGGEDAKVIRIEPKPQISQKGGGGGGGGGKSRIIDFATNSICAAGTGSFLDQQASRLGIAIEQVGSEALRCSNPPTIAARCSVFAKSDMIHLQQVGTPVSDVIAGLCFAMARNFKSNIAKGVSIISPVAFQGGVAANKGMVRAFKEILQINDDDIVIPEYFAFMGAIGSVLSVRDSGAPRRIRGVSLIPSRAVEELENYLATRKLDIKTLSPLKDDDYSIQIEPFPTKSGQTAVKIDAYVGVDVGSISTNVVVVDNDNNVLARRYLMTAGKPLQAVCQGLYEVGQEIGDRVRVRAAGSTGSGRHLTGEFFGADVVKNEITSHSRGAVAVDPSVDTIFEIGGQDSKYISLKDGVVVDFTMNKVCAAGTGSFLEEQAEKLSIKIDKEFSERAFCSSGPCSLGERCTVFMESQLNYYKQSGVKKNDLIAGLAFSIVENYLNRVVEKRKIGNRIFFQGGVGFNRAVKNAFELVLGKKVIVPPHHDIIGAIGVAILAKDTFVAPSAPLSARKMEQIAKSTESSTLFKGFDLRLIKHTADSFECTDCPNKCEIHRVKFTKVQEFKSSNVQRIIPNRTSLYEATAPASPKRSEAGESRPSGIEPSPCVPEGLRDSGQGSSKKTASENSGTIELSYGSRCGKYDTNDAKEKHPDENEKLPNLFVERQKMLLQSTGQPRKAGSTGQPTIGIPSISVFYDLYPLWGTFFSSLGLSVVLSGDTNRTIVKKGVENIAGEPCFPIKSANGHIIKLLEGGGEKALDYIFVPFVVTMPSMSKRFERSYNCPYIQALSDTSKSAIDYERYPVKMLSPVFYMDRGKEEIANVLKRVGKEVLGSSYGARQRTKMAIEQGLLAQERFDKYHRTRGNEIISSLSKGQRAVALLTRSYNSYDTGLNLNLVEKLRTLGMLVLPIDFLPLSEIAEEVGMDYGWMYWRAGQKMLSAARYIARAGQELFAVYLTNFNCGPDSYIAKFLDKELTCFGKPYLTLEIDEHSADVGLQTRLEAFIDTINNYRSKSQKVGMTEAGSLGSRPAGRRPAGRTSPRRAGGSPFGAALSASPSRDGGYQGDLLTVARTGGAVLATDGRRPASPPLARLALRGGGGQAMAPQTISIGKVSEESSNGRRTIYIPYMDDHGYIVAGSLRAAGLKAVALELSDERSLEIGRKHTSGRECFPSIITTGDIVKKTAASDFNPGESAFLMPSAKGPCRFGQYNKLHRMVLDEIGLKEVPLVTFDQTEGFHNDLAVFSSTRFKKNLWRGLVLIDLLQKLTRETRPYERQEGETSRVYQDALQDVVFLVERGDRDGGEWDKLISKVMSRFDEIKKDQTGTKPRIGVIGEIYVRSNPFTNDCVVQKLEALGAEVHLPPFEEWLDYIDYIREEDYLLKQQYLSYLKQKITLVFQESEANRIRRHFDGKIRNFSRESPTKEVVKYGARYLRPDLRGEAVLSMGRAVEYAHFGFDGLLNIIPFGCMPGTIVSALLKRFKQDFHIPVLTITVDGIKNPGEEMRLEAFVAQARELLSSPKADRRH
ncbi:MAG: acyl-CoA dehydratase activase [Planctomycetota bacterium]|nr:acyl-CoA dehydratase activase [Planctomycetota bacterium]MDI6786821.1 acyl-CoA dehydratase activase [Planctomycetota bacterium]